MSEPLPEGISPLLFQAVTLHEQGNLDEAEKVYDRILAQEPYDANVLHFKGVIALSRSDFSTALEYLGKALCWNPRNGSFYCNLGEVYRRRGDNYTAVLAYNMALALDPALPMALLNKGIALRALGCYRDSIQCFETAMTISDYAQEQALLCMGVTYREAGDLAKAKACCMTVLKADSGNVETRQLLREVLTQIQEQGSDQVAPSPSVHRVVDMCIEKAEKYKWKGQFTQALEEVERGLSIVPHDTRLTLLQSSIYEYTGQLDRAIDVLLALGSGMAITKWDKLVYYALLRLFFLSGRIEDARGTLAVISSRKQEWEGVGGLSKYKTAVVIADLISQALSRDSHGNVFPTSKGFSRTLQPHGTIAVIGDSHVLSYAWQRCRIGDQEHTLVPFLVPGLKAWHVQKGSASMPHYAFLEQLKGIAEDIPLLVVCGEIDCRWEEGISHAVHKGLYASVAEGVKCTVNRFIQWLQILVSTRSAQVYLASVQMPRTVLTTAQDPVVARLNSRRRDAITQFNQEAASELDISSSCSSVRYLDMATRYQEDSVAEGKVDDTYYYDDTHASHRLVQYIQL